MDGQMGASFFFDFKDHDGLSAHLHTSPTTFVLPLTSENVFVVVQASDKAHEQLAAVTCCDRVHLKVSVCVCVW